MQMFSLISFPNLSSVIALLGSKEHQAEAILLKESESIPALGKAKSVSYTHLTLPTILLV